MVSIKINFFPIQTGPPQSVDSSSYNSNSTGVIVGVLVAVIVIIAAVVAGVLYYRKRRKFIVRLYIT